MATTATAARALLFAASLCLACGVHAEEGPITIENPYHQFAVPPNAEIPAQPAYYLVPEPAAAPNSTVQASTQLPAPEFLPAETPDPGYRAETVGGGVEIAPPVSEAPGYGLDIIPQPAAYPCCTCPNYCGGLCDGALAAWWQRTKACLQESHWGYPEEFCTRPCGTLVRAHARTQIVNGLTAQMVLYRYDFHDGLLGDAAQLNSHGRKRLGELAGLLQRNYHPVVIERVAGDPELSAARRDAVLKVLAGSAFAVPEEWVVVGDPPDAGLRADEALKIYENLLDNTSQKGALTGGGAMQGGAGFALPVGPSTPSGNR